MSESPIRLRGKSGGVVFDGTQSPGGGSQTLEQVLTAGNDANSKDMIGVWGLQARSIDPNPNAPSGQMPITTGGGEIDTGGGSIDTGGGGLDMSGGGGAILMGGGGISNSGAIDAGSGGINNPGMIDMTGGAITNLADPGSAQDAATKQYVDDQTAVAQGNYDSPEATSIADGAQVALPLVLNSGTALLDLSVPAAPTFVSAGCYAITLALTDVLLTAGGSASYTMQVGAIHYADGLQWIPIGGGEFIAPRLTVVNVVSAGAALTVEVQNGDGAVARDFSISEAIIVRL